MLLSDGEICLLEIREGFGRGDVCIFSARLH